MKPPPPRLPASGCTTARANPTATAASTALPPRRRMSRPTALAMGLPETTMALGASVTRALPDVTQVPRVSPGHGPCRPDSGAGEQASSDDGRSGRIGKLARVSASWDAVPEVASGRSHGL